VGLDDRSLELRLSLPLPTQMPEDRPLLKTLAGKKLGLSIGGTLDMPEVDMDGTLRSTVEGIVGRALPSKEATGDEAAQTSDDDDVAAGSGDGRRPAAAKPTTQLGAVGAAVAEQVRGQLPPDAVDAETADAVVDLVGGILDEVGRRRAARKAAEEAAAEEAAAGEAAAGEAATNPPAEEPDSSPAAAEKPARSRGGLLRRILDRVDEATAPKDSGGATPAEAGGE